MRKSAAAGYVRMGVSVAPRPSTPAGTLGATKASTVYVMPNEIVPSAM